VVEEEELVLRVDLVMVNGAMVNISQAPQTLA